VYLYSSRSHTKKFITPQNLFDQTGHGDGIVYISIAGAGILVNGLGTIIFAVLGGHGHSHGGHGHSHGGHGHSNGEKNNKKSKKEDEKALLADEKNGTGVFIEKQHHKDLNMSAVFLHYLGDCVASGVLLASGLITYFVVGKQWTEYLDPIASLLIAGMLLWSSVPLTKECCYLLLQQVPKELDMSELRRYISQIVHLQGYHDLHIWKLADDITIGTVHACISDTDVAHTETVTEDIKKAFHKFDVHSTTVQVEILSSEKEDIPYRCKHNCKATCTRDWCCRALNNTPLPIALNSNPGGLELK